MTPVNFTTTYGDEVIEPNSQREFELFGELLREVDKSLQDGASHVVPGLFHDELNKLRSAVMTLSSKSLKIADDLKRWDGDMEKALEEARYRGDIK
jgi:hypothetical protein